MKPTIYIDPEPLALFWELTDQADTEVGGFGYITEREIDGYLYPIVDHIFLVDQEVTSSKIDFDDDQLAAAIEQAVTDDRLEDLRFCIHSHCNHSVFWSGTDDELIQNIGETGAPYLFSAVVNKKRETLGRLDIYKHNVPGVATIEKTCHIAQTPLAGIAETATALLDKHCSKPALVTTSKRTSYTKSSPSDLYYYGPLNHVADPGETLQEARERFQQDPDFDIDKEDQVWIDTSDLDDQTMQAIDHIDSIPGTL